MKEELINKINDTFPKKQAEVIQKAIKGNLVLIKNTTQYNNYYRAIKKLRRMSELKETKKLIEYDEIKKLISRKMRSDCKL